MDTIYNVLESISIKGTVVTFHGGCFKGGNTTWDKDQNQLLADMGYEVHQVAFPKKWSEFLQWAKRFDFSQLRWKPIYVIGRSSGGYLAKVFYDTYKSEIVRLYVFVRFLIHN